MSNINNEPDKPVVRKTWTMLKKAYTPIEFTTSIVPAFVEKDKTSTLVFKHANDYGTWSLVASVEGTYGIYSAVDKKESSSWWVWKQSNFQSITIELPEGLSIAPETFFIDVTSASTDSYIDGYDPKTNEWVVLCITKDTTFQNCERYLTVPEELRNYYTKFRFNVRSNYQYSAMRDTNISEFDLIKGKYIQK